ncbi:septin-interacting protein 1 [Coccinella septempunctata]|uniref:septin-interacting protein 1 n=1 Tax=Coccinella septempunctata TaxID=41139 RepID=UPI001D07D26A|nr:septin-interacting protein 1 [Coccinella septempunctata]
MDDEVIRFEITNHDLDNEFNTRRGTPLSKEQKIYGIWADDESDEDDKRSAFKNGKESKNYSAPIDFVAGGVHQVGEKKVVKPDDDVGVDVKSEFLETKRNSSGSEDGDETFPRTGLSSETKTFTTEITGDIAGLRTKKSTSHSTLIERGVGNWEKHTKGIGAKLLLLMGFQPGKGLGKDLQGIATPVEAHLRKGRGAIGAYGPEKQTKTAQPLLLDNKISKQERGQEQNGESKWKKVSESRSRYYYRSVDDVIEKGKRPGAYRNSGIASELSKVKVIDMTGPQQRILSGYHALSGLRPPPGVEHFEDVIHKKCSNFALPEIQHNVDLLVDMTEQEIIHLDRKNRCNKDRISALKQEEESLHNLLENEDGLLQNLQNVMDMVDKLVDPSQSFSLGQVSEMFQELQNEFFEEYCRYELAELAPGLVGPLFTSAMAKWSPLITPREFVYVFEQWKFILERHLQNRGTNENNENGIQPYDSLIWHTWMPVMRTCISTWNPRDCDNLISLLELWTPLLPQWILQNMYNELIVPRLKDEVDSWDPMTDTVPIHTWIHPWIPLIEPKLQELIYPIIQKKLGAALTNWHPSDRSAKFMLQPWKRALPEGVFVAFLIKHIVPKLQLCMQSLVISPLEQHLDNWHWVMDWSDMISVGNMTLILDKFFFPRWLQTLALWLNHDPNYTQVTEWYSGWKRMLSDELLAQPTIKENFHKALEMMNRAVKLEQQPGAKESISYLTTLETNVPPPPPPPKVESFAEVIRITSQIPQGFKDLVAKRCEERGILFVPITNKFREAKQVYRMGTNGVQCYIDRNVIFYSSNNSTWLPISLNRLLDLA